MDLIVSGSSLATKVTLSSIFQLRKKTQTQRNRFCTIKAKTATDEAGSYDPQKDDLTEAEQYEAANNLLSLSGPSTELPTEIENSFMQYALSIILGRALPDARDGLKPVHRRILFAMNGLSLGPTGGFRKCARVVGEVSKNNLLSSQRILLFFVLKYLIYYI